MRIVVLALLFSFAGCTNKNNYDVETLTNSSIILDTSSVEYLLDKNNHHLKHAIACIETSDSIAEIIIEHKVHEKQLLKQLIVEKQAKMTQVSDSVLLSRTQVDTLK